MRYMTFAMLSGVLAVGAAASPKYAAPINVAKGTIILHATATYSDGTIADRLYEVRLDADSDGDGIGDQAWLRVRCDSMISTAIYAYEVKSPRDLATGQASGKRMHKPFVIIKELDKSTPMLRTAADGKAVGSTVSWDLATNKGGKTGKPSVATYDVKKVEGSRVQATGPDQAKTMAHDDWHQVTLAGGAPNLCS